MKKNITKILKKLSQLDLSKKRNDYLLVIFIVGIAFFLRVWQIGAIPPGFSIKEQNILNLILKLDIKHLWLPGNFTAAAYVYPATVILHIFGSKIIILRILSAVIGSLTVLAAYIFISKWFTKQIALFTAFLIAISAYHITLSRLIVSEITLPLICLVAFSVLTDAYRTKNIWLFGVAGLIVGSGFYASPSFLFVPILLLVSGGYFYLKNKKFIMSYKQELIIFIISFFSISIPYLVSFIQTPMSYLTNFGFYRSFWQIIMNIGQIPYNLFIGTSTNFFLNVGNEPLVDPFIFITAIFGFLLAIFSFTRRKYFFLVGWFLVFALYGVLKRNVTPLDLVGIIVPLYVFSALVLDFVIDKWKKTFPNNRQARAILIGALSVFFALSLIYNYNRYFIAYKYSKEVKTEFSAKPPIPVR